MNFRKHAKMNRKARQSKSLAAVAIAVWMSACLSVAQESTPSPRYRCEPGQKLVYAVEIELDRGDVKEKLSGTSSYAVQSVDADKINLKFRGGLEQSLEHDTDGRSSSLRIRRPISRLSPLRGLSDGESEIVINTQGELISLKGSSQLPGLLGNLSQLMIEPLPDEGQQTWKTKREIAIITSDVRILRPTFMPRSDENRLTANEICHYTIEKADARQATISRKYDLATAQTVDEKPRFEITGEGTLIFDFQQGAFTQGHLLQKVTIREPNQTTTIPVKVSYHLLDDAEIEERTTQKKEQAQAAADRAISSLDGADRNQILALLRALHDPEVGRPDAELTAKLTPLLQNEDTTVRYMAAKALEIWASEDAVPALLRALQDEQATVRNFAMDTLARLQAETAIQPIAGRLADKTDRFRATEALKKFGSAAEEAVIQQLDDADWMTRLQAVRVLQGIGTDKSRPALNKALTDEQALIRNEAQKALDGLR